MTSTRAVIGWPRWTEVATFSTGSWVAGYPVTNLGILPLARVARSSNLLVASTKFKATLDANRLTKCMALVRHNLSADAQYRLRIWSDTGATVLVHNSGWLPVWTTVSPPSTLDWEADNWWAGSPLAEDLLGQAWTLPIWLGAVVSARVLELEIDDTTNPAGYVEAGLFEIAQGWQVSVNPAYGATFGHRFRTQDVEALGGTRYFERRLKPRVWRGEIAFLPKDEALANGFEHQRQADLDVPFLWLPNPTDSDHWLREVFLARNVNPGLQSYVTAGRHTLPISFEEVL